MGFDEAIARLKRQSEAYDLVVLIWGPGKASGEHFEKRCKIRDEIRRRFFNSDVRFSEEIDLTDDLPGIDKHDYRTQEMWHLAACDICVVLDTSSGAGEEIAHYVSSREAYKLLILTHERYQHSTNFPSAIRRHQNQLFYNEQQYASCKLVEYVLTRLHSVALGKLSGIRV